MGCGVMYSGQVVKIECLEVKFDCSKVRFEWLKGQRSVQHPDIRVNECTPRECTLACKARGFLKVNFECFKVKFEWLKGAEERSTSRGYPSQRMHSKEMYLGLQSTRIFESKILSI